MKIGRVTKRQLSKHQRKVRREDDFDDGWVATHKIHVTKKNYSRKVKHKNNNYESRRIIK